MRSTAFLATFLATLLASSTSAMAAQNPTSPAAQAPLTPIPVISENLPPVGNGRLTKADLEAWLDGFLPYAMGRGDVPGAVVIVVKDGLPLLEKGYGYSNVTERKPVDAATTMFRPGSISKLFTWTSVMQLVEQGKIDLDADVNTYLDFKIPPFDGTPVTMRNIMTHTSGIEEHARGLITFNEKDSITLDEYVKMVPTRIFEPGTTPSYSNFATTVAGYIVQRVSGQSFDDYVDAHIFVPLAMQHSSFRQPLPDKLKPFMSQGYKPGSDENIGYEIVNPAPAGSLASSGADMGRFMLAHLNNGELDGQRILEAKTAIQMHGTALDILPPLHRMLLGFYEADINGHKVVSHAGDLIAFHSDLYLFTNDGIGLFVSFNSGGKDGAAQKIRGDLFKQFANRYLPGPELADGKVDEATAKQHTQQMLGTYEVSRRADDTFTSLLNLMSQSQVASDGKGSFIVSGVNDLGGNPIKWREISPYVWRAANSSDRLAAKVVDGKVVRFSFEPVSPFMLWDRAPWWKSASWLKPGLILAIAALALTVLAWPISALVRRRYGVKYSLTGHDAKAHRIIRLTALVVLAMFLVYAGTVAAFLSDFNKLAPHNDWIVHLLRVLAMVVFPLGLLASVWNAIVVLRSKRVWTAKLWAVVLALSCLIVLWVGWAFHMMGYSASY